MKGYYVIASDSDVEPIDFNGKGSKGKALKKAKELFNNGDRDVFIQSYNTGNEDGYFASEEVIFIKNII